jgi:hypothetical protein
MDELNQRLAHFWGLVVYLRLSFSLIAMQEVETLHTLTRIKLLADARRRDIPRLLMASPATLTQLARTMKKSPAWIRAGWYICFASNHPALAYGKNSRYAEEINAENWTEIVSRPDGKIGIADPRFDASGCRSSMAFALATVIFLRSSLLKVSTY